METAPSASRGVIQTENASSQQGSVQVVKLEAGEGTRHLLLAFVIAFALNVILGSVAIALAIQAHDAVQAAQAQIEVDRYFKQRVIMEMRDHGMKAPE